MNNISMSTLTVRIATGQVLNMRRFNGGDKPVLMCHGLMEDSRAFYGNDLKGLAHDIAMQGYDVFVPDWRGRGLPRDRVNPGRKCGLFEWASQDLPCIIASLKKHNSAPCFVINQGWGGIVFSAMLARNPSLVNWIKGIVYLGTKRKILTPSRFYKLGWAGALKLVVAMRGHIPARGLRIGRVNESARCYQDHLLYSQQQQWLDREDGFDYSKFQLQLSMPPSLYFSGREDKYDVKAFMQTFSSHDGRLVVLNKSLATGRRGGQRMYTKIKDQLPIILRWMNLHVG